MQAAFFRQHGGPEVMETRALPDSAPALGNRCLFSRQLSLAGSTMSTLGQFATVMGLVFAGKLKPVVDTIFPLADIRAAHERLEQGRVLGKIVLAH
jgi:NADPH:quinone reductase-like Zn-dependent oxidoreductase